MMHRMSVIFACLHVHFSYSSAHLRLIFISQKTSVIKDLPILKIHQNSSSYLVHLFITLSKRVKSFSFLYQLLLFLLFVFLFKKKNDLSHFLLFLRQLAEKKEGIFRFLTTNPQLIIHGLFSATTTCSNDRATINIRIVCTHTHTYTYTQIYIYIYISFSLCAFYTSIRVRQRTQKSCEKKKSLFFSSFFFSFCFSRQLTQSFSDPCRTYVTKKKKSGKEKNR